MWLSANKLLAYICILIVLGSACELLDTRCTQGACKNGGTCIEDENFSFNCTCPDGFYGATCEQHYTCSDSLCEHASNCENVVSIFYPA